MKNATQLILEKLNEISEKIDIALSAPTATTELTMDTVPDVVAWDFDELLMAHLKFEESCNLERHIVDGKPHIGWGRCLQTKGLTDDELAQLGVEDEDFLMEVTQNQADMLFENDMADATADAIAVADKYKYWEPLSIVRKVVMVSGAYNLGRHGLSLFRRMHKAIQAGDFEEAAKQLLDSEAARHQAPNRYKRMAEALANDDAKYFSL